MEEKNRKQWEPMTLQHIGRVADVVQQGGGKVSGLTGDPGEPFSAPKKGGTP